MTILGNGVADYFTVQVLEIRKNQGKKVHTLVATVKIAMTFYGIVRGGT